MDITRRTLIASGALGAAALAVPVRAAVAAYDVIVLGAGMSGLNAAALLEAEGQRVLVLEGRQRVGGRVLTLLDQPGTPEFGFNSMGAGYGRGIDAAKRAGIELVDVGPRYVKDPRQQFVLGGETLTREQWAASLKNPLPPAMKTMMPWEVVPATFARANPLKDWADWNAPESAPLDVPVSAFLKAQGLSDAAVELVFNVAPYYGTTADDAAALTYAFTDGWTKGQRDAGPGSFAVKGGNLLLPRAMAARLKGDVLLGREVVAIDSDATGVTVRCGDGARFRAKRVVCSLPFSTLRRVAITPKLAGPQAQAVAALPYQPISIAFLRVAAPYWEADGLPPSMWTDGPLGQVLAQRYGPTPDEVTGLLVFARGRNARRWDAMGKPAALEMVVSELERLRPAARGKVSGAALHSWAAEPFNRGDWAYFHPGQITAFAREMALPAGRVHFCGEHTAISARGLEGALESSERVVAECLSA